jgi:hypothetical protein
MNKTMILAPPDRSRLQRFTLWLAGAAAAALLVAGLASAASVVPSDVQQPGTQPNQVSSLETPDKCDNCHGGYSKAVEPAFNWRGSMMANATRDPIFWATVAIAEQDFDGAGDLCIRCHSTAGWLGGRSTPTDGSGLATGDADGVECDACHKMTNTNNGEHLGVMTSPFIANDEKLPATGYYGTGMLSMSGGNAKLGPYSDAAAKHQFMQSKFHRDANFCGSCHDVSNPVTGDLAHNNGAQVPLAPGTFSGVPGSPVNGKAAFNNFPFQYGIVERTFSEHMSGTLSKTAVSNYANLPADLKAGAIKAAFDSSGGQLQGRGHPLLQLPDLPHARCHRLWRQQGRHPAAHRPAAARHDRRQRLDTRCDQVPERQRNAAAGWRDDGDTTGGARRRQGEGAAAAAARGYADRHGRHAEGDQPDRPQADFRLSGRAPDVAEHQVV